MTVSTPAKLLWARLPSFMGLRDALWGNYGMTRFKIIVEQAIIAVFLLLTLARQVPWASKLLSFVPKDHDFFDVSGPAVYCLVSPWCKRIYIGQTVRGAGERWWEYIRCAELGTKGHGAKLYAFLRRFGWGKYLVLPLATGVGYDLVRVEGTFIGRLSPSLNTIGRTVRAKNKARPGQKERAKKAVGPAVRRSTLIVFTDLATGRRNASLSTLLEEVSRAGGKNITLASSGGQVWGEKWSIVKRFYGTSTVRTDEGKVPLARAKCMMEAGGQFRIAPVEKAENARLRGKGYLRQLLEMPRKKGELKNFDIPKLIFLYRSAREFKMKTTRRVLKEMIADVVQKKTGVEVKKKVNVKNTTGVEQRTLQREVERALNGVMRKEDLPEVEGTMLESCVNREGRESAASTEEEALELARKLKHLVAVPVDRNPGDIVVMCPTTYHHGLQLMFPLNAAYEEVKCMKEKELLAHIRRGYKQRQLDKIGAWNPAAKIGQAYALPKNKDLNRWRPIAPACADGAGTASRRLVKALNFLLEKAPGVRHFNLKATSLLIGNLGAASGRGKGKDEEGFPMAASYDIKEMFTSLPHPTIIQAVDWLLCQWEEKDVTRVRLSRRGSVIVLNKKSLGPGYVDLKFAMIRQLVTSELENTYVMSKGKILKQVIGIPMGRNSSPPLACTLCVRYEAEFLGSLGNDQKLVHGVRLEDDVTLVVKCYLSEPSSIARGRQIQRRFAEAYGEQLLLVRTDDGSNSWDFLGTRITAIPCPIRFLVRPKNKNHDCVGSGELLFCSFQDYNSYSEKKVKAGAITAAFHRIQRHASEPLMVITPVLETSCELRRRGYPPTLFFHTLAKFARVTSSFSEAWKMLAEGLVQFARRSPAGGE
ncbi:hypothetical protein CBR_g29786 [Chara braunii]|uniref:Reverse transcriptase domain-containing protein n=1 Tax=Chara braunii TaxID=69332 RepID=A0A388LBD4_CHABU|nr:hypothetical protein CBR_g29786 [Chara braunii]|eukprot:GBG79637.1 hypothetical protein CBR_g29786 [Chara braunii]